MKLTKKQKLEVTGFANSLIGTMIDNLCDEIGEVVGIMGLGEEYEENADELYDIVMEEIKKQLNQSND